MMRTALIWLLAGPALLAWAACSRGEPAFHDSIEWAVANSDRVVVGKVVKVDSVGKHAAATVDVQETMRGEHEPQARFVLQEYCSGYAKGWLDDGLPMIFFLVKIDGAKRRDKLPDGFQWCLHDNGNGNSAVLLGKTNRAWPGTIDVFTRRFDYLTDPAAITNYIRRYARAIPPERADEYRTLDVPPGTPAYRKVFPPEGPGNAFFLRVPNVVVDDPDADGLLWLSFVLYGLAVISACACIWYFPQAWARLFNRRDPPETAR